MQFTNPIWLLGLTGLLVPIGIHLLSRKESNVIYIGSLRHLEESNTKQSVSLRLNEISLLTIRCLLITLIVLLLSGLNWQRPGEKWLLIEHDVEQNQNFKSLIDSLEQQGFNSRRLSDGFPELTTNDTQRPVNYWKLVEDLATQKHSQVIVLSHNRANGFHGKRIPLPDNVKWLSSNSTALEFTAFAAMTSPDSMTIRTGHTSATLTAFDSKTIKSIAAPVYEPVPGDSVSVTAPSSLRITIAFDPGFAFDKKIMEAALHAVDDLVPANFVISTIASDKMRSDEQHDWLIWLSEKQAPDGSSVKQIVFQKNHSSNSPVLEKNLSGWSLNRRLNEEVTLREKLPLKLFSILVTHEKEDYRLAREDRRTMPDEKMWSRDNITAGVTEASVSASDSTIIVLAMLIMFCLVGERLLAFKRNQ